MNKIRVAHLLHNLGLAGKEQGVLKIVSAMDTSRFQVEIVVLNHIFPDSYDTNGPFEVVKVPRRPGNDPFQIRRLARLFRRRRYDIVYTHSWNTLVEGYFAARMAEVPVKIHGEHGTFENTAVKKWLQPRLWARFDAVTVVSASLRQRMVEEFGYRSANIRVIHNGIDTNRFFRDPAARTAFRKAHGLEDRFVVGTVGRFHPVKDHFTLLRGFARFCRSVPKAMLIFVGHETHHGLYEKYEKLVHDLGIFNRVKFLPPTRAVEQAYNGFDVFCLSSLSEGCSNVILEAMGCGVPVVATRTGGNPELVQHGKTGLLFDVRDAEALATHFQRLALDAPLRNHLARAGEEQIARKFTLQKTVDAYQQLFEELHTQKRSPALDTPELLAAETSTGV